MVLMAGLSAWAESDRRRAKMERTAAGPSARYHTQYSHHRGEPDSFSSMFHIGERVARNSQYVKWRFVLILFYRFRDFKVEKSYLDAWKGGKLCCPHWL